MTHHDSSPVTLLSRRRMLKLAATSTLIGAPSFGHSQSVWPTRPVKLIVPFSPGGAADTSARTVGLRVSELLGQPLTIENRTGGNAVVAAGALLQAPRDGYTFLWDAANQLTNSLLIKDLAFDYRTAFVPVTMAVRAPQALMVRHDFPAKTFEEFLEVAHKNPGTVSCGTPPSGAMGHLAVALLQQRAGIKLIHTPYRGGADAARDLMGGQIDAALITTSTAGGTLTTGKTRMLAVTSSVRNPVYPNIPTIAERGLEGYDMDDWFGLFAAQGTPEAPIRRMQEAIVQASKDPALIATMAPLGTFMVANSSQEFSSWLAQQREVLRKLIRDANITLG